jgi:hypothetical protein
MLWFCNLRRMMPESSRFDAQLINTARRLAAELIAWAAENHAD